MMTRYLRRKHQAHKKKKARTEPTSSHTDNTKPLQGFLADFRGSTGGEVIYFKEFDSDTDGSGDEIRKRTTNHAEQLALKPANPEPEIIEIIEIIEMANPVETRSTTNKTKTKIKNKDTSNQFVTQGCFDPDQLQMD